MKPERNFFSSKGSDQLTNFTVFMRLRIPEDSPANPGPEWVRDPAPDKRPEGAFVTPTGWMYVGPKK